jgi:hypothetical protein
MIHLRVLLSLALFTAVSCGAKEDGLTGEIKAGGSSLPLSRVLFIYVTRRRSSVPRCRSS